MKADGAGGRSHDGSFGEQLAVDAAADAFYFFVGLAKKNVQVVLFKPMTALGTRITNHSVVNLTLRSFGRDFWTISYLGPCTLQCIGVD
jgi:hypothetical protein